MFFVRTSLKLLVFVTFTVLLVLLLRHWMATKQYVFNKEDVAKLAKQYAGKFPLYYYFFFFFKLWSLQCEIKASCRILLFLFHQLGLVKTASTHVLIHSFTGQDHEQAFNKVVVELRKRYVASEYFSGTLLVSYWLNERVISDWFIVVVKNYFLTYSA